MRKLIPLFLALAACSGGDKIIKKLPNLESGWQVGAPDHHGTGTTIEIPNGGRVNYITRSANDLGRVMSVTFTIDAPLYGPGCGGSFATASLYFQKANDDWRTDGNRWWATFSTVTLDHAGEYTITAPMDGPWTSVESMTAVNDPRSFGKAKADVARVGFTLGNCTGYGHGAVGPATLQIIRFVS